jgi:hypothetical protein
MAIDASGGLGSRQLAGVKVKPPGLRVASGEEPDWQHGRGFRARRSATFRADLGGHCRRPGAGGIAELTIDQIGGAVVCLAIAKPGACYGYRIWTLRTRRLLLIL